MPTYITLYKWTEQGVKDIKNAPARMEAAIKAVEQKGGKVLSLYVVTGEYDLIAVVQAPNDEMVVANNLALAALGNVRTTTLRAFTPKEFADLVKQLP